LGAGIRKTAIKERVKRRDALVVEKQLPNNGCANVLSRKRHRTVDQPTPNCGATMQSSFQGSGRDRN